jgi:hypothetical protein
MIQRPEKLRTIDGIGDVYRSLAPLDMQIESFAKVEVPYPYLVSSRETIELRLRDFSNDWTRTCVAPIAVHGEPTVLYNFSPWMNQAMASIAVDAHKRGVYPKLPREFYESVRLIAESEENIEPEYRTAFIVSARGDIKLTPQMDETKFLLGERAKEYFRKNEHKIIRLVNLSSSSERECAVNYLWIDGPRDGSCIVCNDHGLNYTNGQAFALLRKQRR